MSKIQRGLATNFSVRTDVCHLKYIPKYLHRNGRSPIDEFSPHELLYWRNKFNSQNPFQSVTLSDISVNRSGFGSVLSYPDDVLFNLDQDIDQERFDLPVLTIFIMKLFKGSTARLVKESYNGEEGIVEIRLEHDPLNCNYSHSLIRFFFEGQYVPFPSHQYRQSLGGGNNKGLSKILRKACKDEIHKAIVHKKLVLNNYEDVA